MVKSGIWAVALVVSTIFLVGCSDSPAPLSLNRTSEAVIEGVWVGQGNVTGGSMAPVGSRFDLTMTVSQVGNGVTGKILNGDGSELSLAGTVTGQDLTFTLTKGSPCAGKFSGSGTAMHGDTQLIGDYSGTDCRGTISAEFKTSINDRMKPSRVHETTPILR